MAAVYNPGLAQKLPASPPALTATERPESLASFKSLETETVAPTERGHNDHEDLDDSLVLAIRALRLLENPQAAATEAIEAFDPKANLHPDLVRLLVAAAVRHPDVAQGLIELGAGQNGHIIRRTPSGTLQATNVNGVAAAARHATGLVHEISISSLLSSISENTTHRRSSADAHSHTTTASDAGRPTLKRRLSVLSNKNRADAQQMAATPPRRKEKISTDIVQKICRANLRDTKESIEKLERVELEDDTLTTADLKRLAEESLGHETGKFALCLALTLRDAAQRWEAVKYLMDAMVDKLKLLLSVKGVFGPAGSVGLPGQDAFGIRDCWVVLSEAERERLAMEDKGGWPQRLREAAQLSPQHAERAWEIIASCEKIQEALAPSPRPSQDGDRTSSDLAEGEGASNAVAKRPQAVAAASPQEITDRWAFFFDLLDEEGARRCFRELRLLRQLFNVAQTPGDVSRSANFKSKAKKAFDMTRSDDDLERWLDTRWAINAMRGFMVSKVEGLVGAAGEVNYESLDKLDNAFCKVFWSCLASGDHKRLAAEEGKQWVTDIMKVFEDRRRHDIMFRLRDILHFMQINM